MTRDEIVAYARTFIGWGWRHQARGPDTIDCVGLPILIARHFGIIPQDFDVTGYSRTSDLYKLVDHFREHLEEKSKLEHMPGDLLVTRDFVMPCHCGIVGNQTLIHARASLGTQGKSMKSWGQVREDPLKPWFDLSTHCFAFPGVN